MTTSGVCAKKAAQLLRHFTGKERDGESGNDYMFARYYNSATGRFLSPDWDAKSDDPVPYAKLDQPQSLNLYSYVLNNPVDKADPDGHCIPWCTAALGALAGGAGSIIAQEWHNRNDPNAKLNVKEVLAASAGGFVAGLTLGVLTAPAVVTTLAGSAVVSTSGLATTMGAGAIGGTVGGITERLAGGKGANAALNPKAVVRDAAIGAGGELLNAGVARGVEQTAGGTVRNAESAVDRLTPGATARRVTRANDALGSAQRSLGRKVDAATTAAGTAVNAVDKANSQ